MPLPFGHKPDSILIQASRLIHETLDSLGASVEEIAAIMVAVASPIDWKHQQIGVLGILPDWDDVDIVAHFKILSIALFLLIMMLMLLLLLNISGVLQSLCLTSFTFMPEMVWAQLCLLTTIFTADLWD